MQNVFIITVVCLLFLSPFSSFGKTCSEVFKRKTPVKAKSLETLINIERSEIKAFSQVIEPTSLKAHNISNHSKIFPHSQLKKIKAEDWGLTQKELELLVAEVKPGEVLFFTPFGPSIWKAQQLSHWLEYGDSGKTSNDTKAQAFLESLLEAPQKAKGLSPFWVEQMRASSKRREKARTEANDSLSRKYPDPQDPFYRKPFDVFVQFSKLERAAFYRLHAEEGAIEFAWGTDARFSEHYQMAPHIAIEVINILTNLALLENTVIFSGTSVQRIGRDRAFDIEHQLMFAYHPEIFVKASHFFKYPMNFDNNPLFTVGGVFAAVNVFEQTIKIDNESFILMADIFDGNLTLDIIPTSNEPFSWAHSQIGKDVKKTLLKAVEETLETKRPAKSLVSIELGENSFHVQFEQISLLNSMDVLLNFFNNIKD